MVIMFHILRLYLAIVSVPCWLSSTEGSFVILFNTGFHYDHLLQRVAVRSSFAEDGIVILLSAHLPLRASLSTTQIKLAQSLVERNNVRARRADRVEVNQRLRQ